MTPFPWMPRHPRTQRLLWFFGLWLASVAATLMVAGVLRWLFARILS
jgi:hypothetical protein